jgi:NADH-quinone oxidoreductase subunit N
MAEGEFYSLGLLSILGALVLVSSGSLLTLYLGLELLSLPLYALIAMRRDSLHSIEAAMKYFIMGAVASAFLLYGFSLVYGLTGSFELETIANHLTVSPAVFACGVMFVLVAIAFKLGVVPFHGWVADVYQGAPTSVTIFLGSVPKLAVIGLFFRLFSGAFASHQAEWAPVLEWLAILSIFIGNILAIAQTNLKRLLGYSTIAHMGFLFLAFSLGTEVAEHAALFYGVTYALTTVAAFGLLLFMSRLGVDVDTLDDIRGLNKHHSWLAFMMLVVFLSMAGIPPLVGFDAKLFVLKALLDSHHLGLVIYALVMSVVAVGYYLRVIKVMFFEEPSLNAHVNEQNRSKLSIFYPTGLLLSLNVLAILAVGLFPNGLYTVLCFPVGG